jgi:hypothetical protein
MSFRQIALSIVLITFSILCAWAVAEQGYLAVWIVPFEQPVMTAVGVDLAIALSLAMIWMFGDARRVGRTLWPYLLLTVTCGSVGILLYLLLAAVKPADQRTGVPV